MNSFCSTEWHDVIIGTYSQCAMFSCQTIESNEATIKFLTKLQRFFHPDEKQTLMEFIAFSNCFHGRTIGVVALTSKEHYR
ncbi:hypothetical protein MTR67_034984 [Solanum verrucosum]|uniref:Uncharacterized protein n=1 Tax=Solanum verrucosum TaxID=315347 RepID=A0AAF0ZLV3_SOLVR|nr:hypothetical protein MTR67_034984 [Solanum verrucosum]